MATTARVNVMHNLGEGRRLHCFETEGSHVADLRHACAQTSFRAEHTNLEELFNPAMLAALFQTDDQGERRIIKGVDGHVAVVRAPNGDNRIQAFIRDAGVCAPQELKGDLTKGKVQIYVIAHPPQQACQPFLLRMAHEGVLPANEISSFSPIDHMIAQVASAIPLDDNKARIIFESPNLGTLKGVMLRGPVAHALKTNFLDLIRKTKGRNMYDIPLDLTQEISQALMLNNPSGQVCCARIKNGLLGYRSRVDGGKTFIFVCNSDDFLHNRPTADMAKSILQLFKMSYADTSIQGARISIEISGNEHDTAAPCRYNTPLIHLGMTVQDVLNVIEFACRNAMLTHLGCADYPAHWKAHKEWEEQQQPAVTVQQQWPRQLVVDDEVAEDQEQAYGGDYGGGACGGGGGNMMMQQVLQACAVGRRGGRRIGGG